ncbi:Pre-mRNA-splicing factor cwf16 [Coemansia sp. RSA 353]|nr:Pre-mRNA-splicing factor cwf16 [Coemansia sp. RSA 562]KAJ2182657.1 Pre-mRNA-splicing factor cwf16 [Coemansia sp. RSA 532]KAJ2191898.1 Pre-mRNA-splicing factor cwf16 [Coemansia sp. RSA 522]KAJ2204188.1 Pre-mRNA-splicing factor cwf16 [Coemansia sp. RSA 521]KAJ2271187.1 Pre-mRNA-splicing factor cwf16 [Coemansia sp. RSA 370]KAJ2291593.1 Pre-mRNA-splicing factor cwf16 [Coemansia sp. RSA 355]KAJ2300950.1 Pre-mRNA-splicing factor cwf16 [Coemansia sp. RSA 353]KAJ2403756.1 Pre-mRNA-splicing factor
MSERKVLNKYYPPDFDPAKIPRLRLGKSRQIKVRLVAPFAMRCATCGQWIGKGTKFNARKELVPSESFHSIPIYRFYIRCQRCAAEITFKTDPENNNYVAEHGAQRNFEPWREQHELNEEDKKEEEESSEMQKLESRTEQSRREMEVMDALDEVRVLNARGERMGEDAVRVVREKKEREKRSREEEEDEEDEEEARRVFGSGRIKRVCEDEVVAVRVEPRVAVKSSAVERALRGVKAIKKKEPLVSEPVPESAAPEPSLGGMLAAYGSDSDDSD